MLEDRRHLIAHSHALVNAARELCATARQARQAAQWAVARADDLMAGRSDTKLRRANGSTPALTGRQA